MTHRPRLAASGESAGQALVEGRRKPCGRFLDLEAKFRIALMDHVSDGDTGQHATLPKRS